MAYETIILAVEKNRAKIILNRTDKLNSFTPRVFAELNAALDEIESDREARVLVFTGAGRAFCAGQDLADPAMNFVDGLPPDIGTFVERHYNPLILRLQRSLFRQ